MTLSNEMERLNQAGIALQKAIEKEKKYLLWWMVIWGILIFLFLSFTSCTKAPVPTPSASTKKAAFNYSTPLYYSYEVNCTSPGNMIMTGNTVVVMVPKTYLYTFTHQSTACVDSMQQNAWYCQKYPLEGHGGNINVVGILAKGNYTFSTKAISSIMIFSPGSSFNTIPGCSYITYTY